MDISTDNTSTPATDDQELANLLADLNQQQHTTELPADEGIAVQATPAPATPVVADGATSSEAATAGDPAAAETATTVEPASETKLLEQPEAETAPVESTESVDSAKPVEEPVASIESAESTEDASVADLDLASLSANVTDIATPSPLNVIDELNARETAPAIVGSTTTMHSSPTMDELADSPGAKPLELLEIDDTTIAAATHEAGQLAETPPVATDAQPTAVEEINVIRDKILDYLAETVRDIDQPPQEKFETIVSILSSTGDRSLLKEALETAIQIEDINTKVKALVKLSEVLKELSAQNNFLMKTE
ncbi:hypothetical protein FWF93_00215 [Candidatus Saccharibacteria bacterium]|nr:hypothetical protein [Candidatus Saccharibacteria bacterium]